MSRSNFTPDEKEKMDQGASLIPDHVQGLWVDKEQLFAVRKHLAEDDAAGALKLVDSLLKIKRPRAKRQHPNLHAQFTTADGLLVVRGKITGFNENGYGAQVNLYWQNPSVSTKRTDHEGKEGTTVLYCPPNESYPYNLPSALLRIEPSTSFKNYQAFVAVKLLQPLTTELVNALAHWGTQVAAYQKAHPPAKSAADYFG